MVLRRRFVQSGASLWSGGQGEKAMEEISQELVFESRPGDAARATRRSESDSDPVSSDTSSSSTSHSMPSPGEGRLISSQS